MAFKVFERLFKEYGLSIGIRSDNGVPFASPMAIYGLSKLAVWWLRLGIHIERIEPGNPQLNGRHERMGNPHVGYRGHSRGHSASGKVCVPALLLKGAGAGAR